MNKQQGYSLLGMLINLALGIIIFSALLHYLCIITKVHNRLQRNIDYQNSQLIAYHYLSSDIRNSGYNFKPAAITCKAIIGACLGLVPSSIESLIRNQDIPPNSDILILNSATENIAYYLRKSITTTENHWRSYTLYRDNFKHNAAALTEGLINFYVTIMHAKSNKIALQLKLEFKNLQTMVFICVPRNNN